MLGCNLRWSDLDSDPLPHLINNFLICLFCGDGGVAFSTPPLVMSFVIVMYDPVSFDVVSGIEVLEVLWLADLPAFQMTPGVVCQGLDS